MGHWSQGISPCTLVSGKPPTRHHQGAGHHRLHDLPGVDPRWCRITPSRGTRLHLPSTACRACTDPRPLLTGCQQGSVGRLGHPWLRSGHQWGRWSKLEQELSPSQGRVNHHQPTRPARCPQWRHGSGIVACLVAILEPMGRACHAGPVLPPCLPDHFGKTAASTRVRTRCRVRPEGSTAGSDTEGADPREGRGSCPSLCHAVVVSKGSGGGLLPNGQTPLPPPRLLQRAPGPP